MGLYDDTAAHEVKVMATYAGDFNLDGVVDNADKAIWLAHAFTGTGWQQGDANYDGVGNGLDRDLWLANVGLAPLPVVPSGLSSVPEPGTLALVAACPLGFLAYTLRRRRRRT